MRLKKFSSLFLIFLIMNLNMVVPGVSYATAEETCSCHINSADHKCHCDKGCESCGMHEEMSGKQHSATAFSPQTSMIKGKTCSTSPENDNSALLIQATPFIVPIYCTAVPLVNISGLHHIAEKTLQSISKAPVIKPPIV